MASLTDVASTIEYQFSKFWLDKSIHMLYNKYVKTKSEFDSLLQTHLSFPDSQGDPASTYIIRRESRRLSDVDVKQKVLFLRAPQKQERLPVSD